jgi:hypothetical protein
MLSAQTSKYIKQWCKENNTYYPLRNNGEITLENKKEVRKWARKCVRKENRQYINNFVENYRSKEYHDMYISSPYDYFYPTYYIPLRYYPTRFYPTIYCR